MKSNTATYTERAAKTARIHRREQATRKVVHVVSVSCAVVIAGILIYMVTSVLRHPISGSTANTTTLSSLPLPLPAAPVKHEEAKPVAPPAAPVVASAKVEVAPAPAPRTVYGRFVLSADRHTITVTDDGFKDLTLGITHPVITLDHQAVGLDGLKPELAVNVLYTGTEVTQIEQTSPPPPVASTSSPAPAPVVAQAGTNDKPKKKKKKDQTPPPAAATTPPTAN